MGGDRIAWLAGLAALAAALGLGLAARSPAIETLGEGLGADSARIVPVSAEAPVADMR